MTDLVFDRKKNILKWLAKGKEWGARSGPWGAGVLPAGVYDISRREITQYTTLAGKAFKDSTGKGFFLPIYPPIFKTSRGSNGRLGIHPDGNKPGTEGCIGLTDTNTKSFYDAIANSPVAIKLSLLVK